MEVLVDKNIKFLGNTRTDVSKLYTLQSERMLYSVVEAFGCPTTPVIYLQVLDITDNGERFYWVRVIAEAVPLSFLSIPELKYQYHFETVQCITTCKLRA